ncbi:MAG: nucleotidyltransferase family protein [Dehalococcoidia bacterium]|nr:nucleotidyltransferase family protein [Dehalococcoidia bacterium]
MPARSHNAAHAAIILLAAGESSRMGQPKQLLPWRGVPLLAYQIREAQATSAGAVIVVLGSDAATLRPIAEREAEAGRTRIVVNRRYRQGKTTSIVAGLRALEQTPAAVMLLAVDQPRPRAVLERLLDRHAAGGHLISVPAHRSRHGHPPIFDTSLIPDLLRITEAGQGIREVIERHRDALREIEIDNPVVLTNLNRPQDYRAAYAAFGQPPPHGALSGPAPGSN